MYEDRQNICNDALLVKGVFLLVKICEEYALLNVEVHYTFMRFQVLMAAAMKKNVFWDVTQSRCLLIFWTNKLPSASGMKS
jgi:hypothetical protein